MPERADIIRSFEGREFEDRTLLRLAATAAGLREGDYRVRSRCILRSGRNGAPCGQLVFWIAPSMEDELNERNAALVRRELELASDNPLHPWHLDDTHPFEAH